ncbi:MAG: YraN family protein [Pseudomonadota bacterium]|uniref:YraN family protein n=1 Tax=Polaromonas sp. TaxID=1869339 RepID=UPI001840286B|nr:YraN family protein [Polaromonas sp.]MBA3592456.1 YraN family protein [Polaromonas sp.]MDQ3271787.1 YraN family protein [Pseudomonadota bacterium]
MWFSRKQVAKVPAATGRQPGQITTKRLGDAAELLARDHLVRAGLKLLQANYRTPGRGGGEVDLIMAAPDGTLVFVEVRQRRSSSHGGAGASIGTIKQQRIVFAARHYLMRFASPPPCRFDVVLVQGGIDTPGGTTLEWLRGAFDAD